MINRFKKKQVHSNRKNNNVSIYSMHININNWYIKNMIIANIDGGEVSSIFPVSSQIWLTCPSPDLTQNKPMV
jgi:hypothetical protein